MGLTNNPPSLASRRVGGVRHRPEVDIESIRELLHGYASARSILKELIQNAEDAGASRMDVLYLPGDEASPHYLLKGPSLLVVNDGGFAEEHRDAISQISLGTKGTEDRAIGRFGKDSRASLPGAKRSSSSPVPTRNWAGRTPASAISSTRGSAGDTATGTTNSTTATRTYLLVKWNNTLAQFTRHGNHG